MAGRPRNILLALALLLATTVVPAARQDRAPEILALARQAIGGETRLNAVTSLSIKGSSQSDLDGMRRLSATLEIDLVPPTRFVIIRDWPAAFLQQVGGFNGTALLEQVRNAGVWRDTPLGDARTDGRALAVRHREVVRYLLAWLLTVPARYQVVFRDAGEEEVAKSRADVIEATGAYEFAARLFFDRKTRRLLMITYRETPSARTAPGPPIAPATGQPLFTGLEMPDAKADVKMTLADYRSDGAGISTPHKVKFEIESLSEDWDISRVTLNETLDPAKFLPRR